MEARFQCARVRLWGKIHFMPHVHPVRLVYQASANYDAHSDAGDEPFPRVDADDGFEVMRPNNQKHGWNLWPAQVQRDLYSLGLEECWRRPESLLEMFRTADTNEKRSKEWKIMIKQKVKKREQVRWKRCIHTQTMLRTYIQFKSELCLEDSEYLCDPHGGWNDLGLSARKFLTQLRTGSNQLRINTGRWCELPVEERICLMCAKEVETEQHFLLECSYYENERMELFSSVDKMIAASSHASIVAAGGDEFIMKNLPTSEQLSIMMANNHTIIEREKLSQKVRRMIALELVSWQKKRENQLEMMEEE